MYCRTISQKVLAIMELRIAGIAIRERKDKVFPRHFFSVFKERSSTEVALRLTSAMAQRNVSFLPGKVQFLFPGRYVLRYQAVGAVKPVNFFH